MQNMQDVKNKKQRCFEIIQIGYDGDAPSKAFDIAFTILIFTNLFIAIFDTFDASIPFLPILDTIELITVLAFTVEYVLRLWTVEYLYPYEKKPRALVKYIFSFSGIMDLLSFFPYYLPVFFPSGAVAFRIFRVARILRLFRVNAYSDAMSVISEVVDGKKDQLKSSVFIILILMMASSLCMYGLEHEAQPDVFKNAFSGFWWSVSTLLTVGYGDIYPVTLAGRMFGIVITFLGVGMVAIPTGILSAGFVEQYTRLKNIGDVTQENRMRFITIHLEPGHEFVGKTINEAALPAGLNVALIKRQEEMLLPTEDFVFCENDQVVINGEGYLGDSDIHLKEIELLEHHPWAGKEIKRLDISRQSLLVAIRRGEEIVIPNGKTVLEVGDVIIFYSKRLYLDAQEITI